jgi:hypothetical protein
MYKRDQSHRAVNENCPRGVESNCCVNFVRQLCTSNFCVKFLRQIFTAPRVIYARRADRARRRQRPWPRAPSPLLLLISPRPREAGARSREARNTGADLALVTRTLLNIPTSRLYRDKLVARSRDGARDALHAGRRSATALGADSAASPLSCTHRHGAGAILDGMASSLSLSRSSAPCAARLSLAIFEG